MVSRPKITAKVYPPGHLLIYKGVARECVVHDDEKPVRVEVSGNLTKQRVAEVVLDFAVKVLITEPAPPKAMRFNLHPWKYRVRICPGPLVVDGVDVAGMTHRREILISGTLGPHGDRLEVLIDQLRRTHAMHYGPLNPEGIASFFADVMRQLLAQGGEQALRRMAPET